MSAVTETEAKTKWCPFVRFAAGYAGDRVALNRWKQSEPIGEPYALNPVPCRCIASECMAWRWALDLEGVTLYQVTPMEDSPGHSLNAPMGFCGLAGTPKP